MAGGMLAFQKSRSLDKGIQNLSRLFRGLQGKVYPKIHFPPPFWKLPEQGKGYAVVYDIHAVTAIRHNGKVLPISVYELHLKLLGPWGSAVPLCTFPCRPAQTVRRKHHRDSAVDDFLP